ncbi:MAG: cytochrome c3 family protein [Acidobacteria bacterium]|nr:cytochrome c3 family protein [Acidobacteriota bacterium]
MKRLVLAAFVLLAVDTRAQTPPETAFEDDVHAAAGLTCASCHKTEAAGAYAAPARTSIAPLCASCHSDAAYMRTVDPQVRVDQYLQYQTSTHGKRMAAGDARVATCSDCHGAHGVRRVRDARSPVAPANVVTTCGRCHGDPARMAAFGRQATHPAEWAASVHAAALIKRGDTSAPTCVSCHGSHGATPPGVTSVANVCAQCHLREAELFRASPKREIFDAIGQAECLVCHGNHRIESPADQWVGLEKGAVCEQCHDAAGDSGAAIRDIRQKLDTLQDATSTADARLTRAEHAGMLVEDGRLALQLAREHQVQSRALVHAFAPAPFAKTAADGVAAARRAREAGEAAMRELQLRRQGLGVATLLVLAFLATLWVKIRRLPPA